MVSRYLVDGILIGGLLIGTLGVFYMSNGLFGERGNTALRSSFALAGVFVLIAIQWASSKMTSTRDLMITFQSIPLPEGLKLAVLLVADGLGLLSILLACLILIWVAITGRYPFVPRLSKTILKFIPVTFALLIILYAVFFHQLLSLVSLGVLFAANYCFWRFGVPRISTMDSRQLQFVGLILTLLGIATQFIPPLFDLLGIKIV